MGCASTARTKTACALSATPVVPFHDAVEDNDHYHLKVHDPVKTAPEAVLPQCLVTVEPISGPGFVAAGALGSKFDACETMETREHVSPSPEVVDAVGLDSLPHASAGRNWRGVHRPVRVEKEHDIAEMMARSAAELDMTKKAAALPIGILGFGNSSSSSSRPIGTVDSGVDSLAVTFGAGGEFLKWRTDGLPGNSSADNVPAVPVGVNWQILETSDVDDVYSPLHADTDGHIVAYPQISVNHFSNCTRLPSCDDWSCDEEKSPSHGADRKSLPSSCETNCDDDSLSDSPERKRRLPRAREVAHSADVSNDLLSDSPGRKRRLPCAREVAHSSDVSDDLDDPIWLRPRRADGRNWRGLRGGERSTSPDNHSPPSPSSGRHSGHERNCRIAKGEECSCVGTRWSRASKAWLAHKGLPRTRSALASSTPTELEVSRTRSRLQGHSEPTSRAHSRFQERSEPTSRAHSRLQEHPEPTSRARSRLQERSEGTLREEATTSDA